MLLVVPAALGLGFVVLLLVTSNFYVLPSAGMEPTLHCPRPEPGCESKEADRVVVWKLLYHLRDPHRGDIVAFHPPALARERCGSEGIRIKRIVARGGETWEERNGHVYIDGHRLSEAYVSGALDSGRSYPPRRIPSGSFFLMGDNRADSCDSREWGTVTRSAIIGPVVTTYWPLHRLSTR